MSATTQIAWATHTASPWFGCTKVSEGCRYCYAETLTLKNHWAGWGDSSPRVKAKGFWKEAYRLNSKAIECERFMEGQDRPRMFTSLMDWLDPMVPIAWLADFLRVVHDCQNLDWLLLTKRPELWRSRLQQVVDSKASVTGSVMAEAWLAGGQPKNVWLGTTVENQSMADHRIPDLIQIPARIRWLSVEPLLEHINLAYACFNGADPLGTMPGIDWVVVGGESGNTYRDCGLDPILDIVRQCQAANIPIFVKQDAALKPGQQGRIPNEIWSLKQYP